MPYIKVNSKKIKSQPLKNIMFNTGKKLKQKVIKPKVIKFLAKSSTMEEIKTYFIDLTLEICPYVSKINGNILNYSKCATNVSHE